MIKVEMLISIVLCIPMNIKDCCLLLMISRTHIKLVSARITDNIKAPSAKIAKVVDPVCYQVVPEVVDKL